MTILPISRTADASTDIRMLWEWVNGKERRLQSNRLAVLLAHTKLEYSLLPAYKKTAHQE